MKTLTVTLLTDGTSDRTLLPIVQFLLDEWSPFPHRTLFADGLHSGALNARLPRVIELFPCDLLFIHRDAEREPLETRVQEIQTALAESAPQHLPHICLVPVRMTESWLLLDEPAIRSAAGNPDGRTPLKLPKAAAIEGLADPKSKLFESLTAAAEVTGRHRRRFSPEAARHRVAEILDPSVLRQLASFQFAEKQVRDFFRTNFTVPSEKTHKAIPRPIKATR
ncbi:DUF4276 family protein [Burkholderia glumae]|uniref:DUF4276 family protein n=1 Tax=Burkholderia glumae TaxID=337 RepID=A0AAP9Y4Z7_BURGL|nr:DUF4276 family protein [Burkholderia glumae]ACR28349.1 Hypothetical protein bglu_1g11810 [Burkholderia glumae BGR1]AJY67024.1 hypothetical protein KS03_2120 [Burkholderia glumae LMG 2196 = ATCC 33617]MCM2480656.1 DUF4276 family protein [Burkholderia glumae]MCM2509205.1 DUF4276 family protein [Burkholderia glumae]MCM2537670.1 DUF4276 family protein [Burkholderia glumae]